MIFLKLLDIAKRWQVKEPKDRADLHEQYRQTFGTDAGKVVLADICKRNFVFGSAFHPNAHEAAHNEGRRFLALSILTFVNKHPDEVTHDDSGSAGT